MRIAVYHLNQLGDFLFSLPLLNSLKNNYPDSNITLLLPSSIKSISLLTPYVNETVERPKRGDLRFFRDIKNKNFDWWISLSKSPQSFLAARSSGAERRIGFKRGFYSRFLTESVKNRGPFSLDAARALKQMLALTSSSIDYRRLLSLPETLIKEEEKRWAGIDFSKTITIAPGSSPRRRFKRWPKEEFAKVIDELSKAGFNIYLTGSVSEFEEIDSIKSLAHAPAINLAGKLSLPQLAYFLSQSRLVICNDSGAMHLASVFETPLVALFGPTSPAETGPYNKNSHVIYSLDLPALKHNKVLDACWKLL